MSTHKEIGWTARERVHFYTARVSGASSEQRSLNGERPVTSPQPTRKGAERAESVSKSLIVFHGGASSVEPCAAVRGVRQFVLFFDFEIEK
jgi:hypothetical protein